MRALGTVYARLCHARGNSYHLTELHRVRVVEMLAVMLTSEVAG